MSEGSLACWAEQLAEQTTNEFMNLLVCGALPQIEFMKFVGYGR